MKIDVKWQGLLIISIGIFISSLDGSILNIANPIIAQAFHVNMKDIQWIVTSYMLVITATLLFWGKLGDRIGSERIYSAGFLIFTLGSLLCSLSNSLAFLIVMRIFQGIGASMLMATGMGIVSNIFPGSERGKALGLTGTVVGIGNVAGPALGGLLIANFPWQIIFLINVPIGLIAFVLALKYLPKQESNRDSKASYDIVGLILFTLAAVALLMSLTIQKDVEMFVFLLALVLILIFYFFEKNTNNSMIDFELFRVKAFVYGNITALASYIVQNFVFFLLPFYLESLLNLKPTYSGLLLTITPVSMAITAPLAGNLSDKAGSHRIVSISFLLSTVAFLILSTLGSALDLLKICSGLILMGTAMGLFGSPNNSYILGSIPRQKAGYGGGFMATVRNFSFFLGTALSVSIFTAFLNNWQKTNDYNLAYVRASNSVYMVAAIISFIGFLFSIYAKRQEIKHADK